MSNAKQTKLGLTDTVPVDTVEDFKFEPIKGYPMLTWRGKRPFNSTHYYPAQLKEVHGQEQNGWLNKIFWGDNLQVMSHLLKEFRGKIKLIYIDPPFDSKAEYTKKVSVKGKQINNDQSVFEEKQYTDIWSNDEYLQFMHERLVLIRELLSEDGSIFVHCDWNRNYLIRCLLDEVFGADNIVNEIVWRRKGGSALGVMSRLSNASDTIYWFAKSPSYTINALYFEATQEYIDTQFRYKDDSGRRYMITVMRSPSPRQNLMYDYKGYKMPPHGWSVPFETMKRLDQEGRLHFPDSKEKQIYKKIYLDEYPGQLANNLWTDISTLKGSNSEIIGYPTQKPEELIERIIKLSTNTDDLVMDCFMGSGTTQSTAMKLGRRFIGADINLGAVQITTKRLLERAEGLKGDGRQPEFFSEKDESIPDTFYTGFEIYNVNNYDVFRNPVEAKELLLQALEVNKMEKGQLFDGEKDGRMFKIMPVNRIATRADLGELIAGLDLKAFAKRQKSNPNEPVEKITLVCMGHEPDLKASLMKEADPYKLDVEVVDILRDRQDLQFKRDSEAKVVIAKGKLVIERFYPMNLLGKLSLQKEKVKDWKELVESIMIDWNYDGAVLTPTTVDIPEKDELVSGAYPIPKDAGTIRVKITDLLSESLEIEVTNG